MKRLLALSTVLVIACLTTSCATFRKVDVSPYQVGRKVTVGYLLGKDHVKKEHQAAIKEAYVAFDKVVQDLEVGKAPQLNVIVKDIIKDKVKDEKDLKVAYAFIDIAWEELMLHWDPTVVTEQEFAKVIYEFHKGIRAALRDYDYLR